MGLYSCNYCGNNEYYKETKSLGVAERTLIATMIPFPMITKNSFANKIIRTFFWEKLFDSTKVGASCYYVCEFCGHRERINILEYTDKYEFRDNMMKFQCFRTEKEKKVLMLSAIAGSYVSQNEAKSKILDFVVALLGEEHREKLTAVYVTYIDMPFKKVLTALKGLSKDIDDDKKDLALSLAYSFSDGLEMDEERVRLFKEIDKAINQGT